MSKFANTFNSLLKEEKEGNAFTGALHKSKKGEKIKVNGKQVTNTTGTIPEEKEGNAFTGALKKAEQQGKKSVTVGGKTVPVTGHALAEKKKSMSPFAIGMAVAKKSAGVTKHHELPKAVVKKAHEIGKKINKMMKEDTMPAMPAMEADAASAEPAGGDEAAWKASLDKGTNPKDFETQDNPQVNVDASGVEAASQWIAKLEEMAEFVNGTGPESLNSKINDLELKNSVPFRGVVRREEKRITKLAENLRGLAEVFKSVVIGSRKKIHDATSTR